MMETLKLVITGPMGAGKTAAIQSISTVPVVSTEASAFHESSHHAHKLTTTVAMDYGELRMSDGRLLMIIGTPGQSRYDFMCTILARGALGLIILIDHTASDPVADLKYFLNLYSEVLASTPCVVGITHADETSDGSLDPYHRLLAAAGFATAVPVFPLDARSPDDIVAVLQCILAIIQTTTTTEELSC
jgi:signal recognition particle receptor subunit beta